MTRRNFYFLKTHLYHIFNKAKQDFLFYEREDYQRFLEILLRYQNTPKYKTIRIPAYSLLPDHFHVLIYEQGNASVLTQKISEFLHQIQVSYAMFFKKKYSFRLTSGPLFLGRFEAENISSEKKSSWVNFVEDNAMAHHLCQNPRDWPYTSYDEQLSDRLPKPFHTLQNFSCSSFL